MHELPRASRFRPARPGRPLRGVPRARDHTRSRKPRSWRLYVVPWSFGAQAQSRARLRELPCKGTDQRTKGASSVYRLSRASRRFPPTESHDLRILSREQGRGSTREGERRVRHVPPPSRAVRPGLSSRVRDVSRKRATPGAAQRRYARRLYRVPYLARGSEIRPRDVHDGLPRRSAQPSAGSPDLHRLPRVPQVAGDICSANSRQGDGPCPSGTHGVRRAP